MQAWGVQDLGAFEACYAGLVLGLQRYDISSFSDDAHVALEDVQSYKMV